MNAIVRILFVALVWIPTACYSQIKPPGYEREVQEYEELQKQSFLDRDSVTLMDTTVLYDPDTYEESIKIVRSVMSIRDYCRHILNMPHPEVLVEGQPVMITDPVTYEKLMIQWNPVRSKIDTLVPD